MKLEHFWNQASLYQSSNQVAKITSQTLAKVFES